MARRRHFTDFTTVEIEYEGQKVEFREMDDEWRCSALALKAKSLTALKRKIDKLAQVERRVSVNCIQIGGNYSYGMLGKPAQIVMLAKGSEWENMRHDEQPEKMVGVHNRRVPTVWIMVPSGNHPAERKKVRLDELAFPTESVLASIKEYERLGREIDQLQKARDGIRAAIPRLTVDDIAPKGVEEENLDG